VGARAGPLGYCIPVQWLLPVCQCRSTVDGRVVTTASYSTPLSLALSTTLTPCLPLEWPVTVADCNNATTRNVQAFIAADIRASRLVFITTAVVPGTLTIPGRSFYCPGTRWPAYWWVIIGIAWSITVMVKCDLYSLYAVGLWHYRGWTWCQFIAGCCCDTHVVSRFPINCTNVFVYICLLYVGIIVHYIHWVTHFTFWISLSLRPNHSTLVSVPSSDYPITVTHITAQSIASSLISPYFFVYLWIGEKVKWFSHMKT